ncbi:MAG: IS66 family transposase [Streptosporangiaceae bacterium]
MSGLPPAAPGCASCAARDAELEELRAQVAEVAELRARVARLERALSRNSDNSSMPPSGDDAPGRKPPRKQRRAAERDAAKRRPGKQPGAPGSAMAWAEPDDTFDYYPQGTCGCGADLAGARDLGVARSFQQLEIPEPSAQRIQHDLHAAVCGCGREHVAARPPGVPDSPVSIGPDLRALAVYLVVFQHLPLERCRQLISDVAGARVSAGFIHSCLRKAAGLAGGVIKLIRTLITAAHVAGFDETTLRAGPAGEKKYVLGAFTEQYSLLFLGARTLDSFRDFGILPDFAGVAVTDRYVNYFHARWKNLAGHQACCAHLLRDYQDAAETYPDAHWPAQAQRALRGLIRAWHAARDNGLAAIPAATADPLIREFRRAVTVGLSQVPRIPGPKHSTAQHPGRDLLEFCRDREDDVVRFAGDTRIWPTNNISVMRFVKLSVRWCVSASVSAPGAGCLTSAELAAV